MSRSTGRPSLASIRKDYGFFGPGSATWKVWSYPTSPTVGFERAVVIEELDPFLVASVQHSGAVKARTRLRYDRTLQYFATVMFGDSESVLNAAEILMKIHGKAIGPEPVTGGQFDANDPASQLWIHLTAWHSILYCYEKFGPGRLTEEEENRYWEECALAAEFQTFDTADVPRTRQGIRQYFQDYRPRLVGSESAQDMMKFILSTGYMLPRDRWWLRGAVGCTVNSFIRKATIATIPIWMRRIGGISQSRLTDAVVTLVMRRVMTAVHKRRELEIRLIRLLSPLTAPIMEPVLREQSPEEPVTLTPEQARERYQRSTPKEQYAQLLARRRDHRAPRPYSRDRDERLLDFA